MKVRIPTGEVGTVDQSRSDLMNYWVEVTDGNAVYGKEYPVIKCKIVEMEDEND